MKNENERGSFIFHFSFFDLAKHPRREEPAQMSRSRGRNLIEIDPAHRALLELDRVPRADQPARQFAEARLVTDEREAALARVFFEFRDKRGVRRAGRE